MHISNTLLSFVHRNIESLIDFVNPKTKKEFKHFDTHEGALFDYIIQIENEKPDMYKIIEEIVYGSLISVILYAEKQSAIETLEKNKFSKCTLYVDTNLIFSLLGLDGKTFMIPAKELFSLLRKFNFEFKIFSFTLNEICRVLVSFNSKAHMYINGVDIDSIYSYMRKEGWTKTATKEYITNIEENLRNLGFSTEWVDEKDFNENSPDFELLRGQMEKYKPDQSEHGQNHDLFALMEVSKRRNKKIRKIENSIALFLTSDAKLAKFNFEKMGHNEEGTVSEVILDQILMNILWLKNPNLEIPLESIIATHSRDLFINRRVWERFCSVLQDLKRKGKTNVDEISMMFYHKYIEDILRHMDENQVDQIDEIFVLDKIEKAKQLPKEEMEETLKLKEKEYLQILKEEVAKTEKNKDEEWLCKINEIKKNAHLSAQKTAKSYTWILRGIITILFLVPIFVLLGLGKFDIIARAENIISLFLVALSAFLNAIKQIWVKIETLITEKIYNRQVKSWDLEINEKNLIKKTEDIS